MVEMHEVDSTSIEAIGYDGDARELHVQLKGRHYVYADVPRDVFDGFGQADSAGKYFHAHVRPVYEYRELD